MLGAMVMHSVFPDLHELDYLAGYKKEVILLLSDLDRFDAFVRDLTYALYQCRRVKC